MDFGCWKVNQMKVPAGTWRFKDPKYKNEFYAGKVHWNLVI